MSCSDYAGEAQSGPDGSRFHRGLSSARHGRRHYQHTVGFTAYAARDVRGAPTVVTLTVGGNDLLGHTATFGAFERLCRWGARASASPCKTAQDSPAAPVDLVIVGAVYDPSGDTGDASRVGLLSWPQIVDVLAKLNAELPGVATDMGHGLPTSTATSLATGCRSVTPSRVIAGS
jgi:hypothetical protein